MEVHKMKPKTNQKTNLKGNQHVSEKEDGWHVKREAADRTRKFSSRHEAMIYAKAAAKRNEACIVIHDKSGKFKEFDCHPEVLNQHVIPIDHKWAVVSSDDKEVSRIFADKGEAISYAYGIHKKNNVCMVLEDERGMFTRVTCPPGKNLDISDVFGPKIKV